MLAKRAKLCLRQEVVVWFILTKSYTTAHSGFKGHQYFFPRQRTDNGGKSKNPIRVFSAIKLPLPLQSFICDILTQSCYKI